MKGYSDVATLMGRHVELGILRRFSKLSMQDLLYRVTELVSLEKELQDLAESDAKSERVYRTYFAQDWQFLSNPITDGDEKQWLKILEIRVKLKEFRECLLQVVEMSKLESPDDNSLKELRKIFDERLPFVGLDSLAWQDDNKHDLIVIRGLEERDFFSKWVIKSLIPFYHEWMGKYLKEPEDATTSRICYYSDTHLHTFLHILNTFISSMLPISSVVILYFVPNVLQRLGIVAGMTACFSVSLALLTQARKVEIFAATSAFIAVQVVFLSNNIVSSQ